MTPKGLIDPTSSSQSAAIKSSNNGGSIAPVATSKLTRRLRLVEIASVNATREDQCSWKVNLGQGNHGNTTCLWRLSQLPSAMTTMG